jgi:inner membrane transporter RhtA
MSILLLIASMFSIQVGASLAKGLFPLVGAIPTTMLRITFAALVLNLLFRPWRFKINRKSFKAIALYGACLGIMNMTFYMALDRIPLGITVAVEFLGPLSVAIFFSRKKVDFLWAFLATGGVFLILPLSSSTDHLDLIGIFYAAIAGVCWGLYILIGKNVGQSNNTAVATSLGMLVAAVIILPFGVSASTPQVFQFDVLKLALAVAVLSSAIPYSLEMMVLRNMETKTFGILMSLEPAVAALAGLIFLGEFLTPVQWLAIFFIMIASVGTTVTSSRRAKAQIKIA